MASSASTPRHPSLRCSNYFLPTPVALPCVNMLKQRVHLRRCLTFLAIAAIALAQLPCSAATRDVTTFGAIPNDDTDDAAAIQNAIDATSPGDTVSFPAGTFLMHRTLRPKSGVKIL